MGRKPICPFCHKKVQNDGKKVRLTPTKVRTYHPACWERVRKYLGV